MHPDDVFRIDDVFADLPDLLETPCAPGTVEDIVTSSVRDEVFDLDGMSITDDMSPASYLDLILDKVDGARDRLLRLRNGVVGRDWGDQYERQ